jgi:protein-S-isoprenylcysteine O-methyltransferase Ste14
MNPPARSPWWRGSRGEWFVAAQVFLMALVAFGPRRLARVSDGWPAPLGVAASIAGGLLFLLGSLLLIAGALKLGSKLTPLPYPADGAVLRETGPYRWVRHPMYGGGVLMAFGWGLWVHGELTLIYAALLLLLADRKANREERWLREKFAGYAAYQQRVRKLIPFIY